MSDYHLHVLELSCPASQVCLCKLLHQFISSYCHEQRVKTTFSCKARSQWGSLAVPYGQKYIAHDCYPCHKHCLMESKCIPKSTSSEVLVDTHTLSSHCEIPLYFLLPSHAHSPDFCIPANHSISHPHFQHLHPWTWILTSSIPLTFLPSKEKNINTNANSLKCQWNPLLRWRCLPPVTIVACGLGSIQGVSCGTYALINILDFLFNSKDAYSHPYKAQLNHRWFSTGTKGS